ncbi:hypothetical protein P171DRAFT_437713 [Karstenula rhodostoma CBS 690.94]|uniref:DUF7924 domain-containing protein n=1 Tax=Karstenula rhodostoma CBS 690.94 TaxID=1392251 RepID=A0A9P4U493_9PLEO|nr:hypothetical protein P171DRAFT_437713 [Karstenula rhodostoma CBS 690.94]
MPTKRARCESPAAVCSERPRPGKDSAGDSDSDSNCGSDHDNNGNPDAPECLPARCALLQPLTEAALEALNRSTPAEADCAPESALSMSASATSTSADDLETRRKLMAYHIHVDTGANMPAKLQAHIDTHITKERRPEDTVSPHAHAAKVREDSAIHSLEPALMAGLHGDDEASFPGVAADFKCRLSRALLPPGSVEVRRAYGALAQPEADCSYGYATRYRTAAPSSPVFTSQQETKLHAAGLDISSLQLFPFLTAQWKRPSGTEGIHHAQTQSARDGAAIVNLLHRLHGPNAALADTCHFSCATDGEQVQFFVHWRAAELDGDAPVAVHYMKWLDSLSMRKPADMRKARNVIKNIAAYAVGPRLAAIGAAIDACAIPQQKRHAPTESDAAPTAVPAGIPADAPAGLFPSPRSSVSSRPTRRQKT